MAVLRHQAREILHRILIRAAILADDEHLASRKLLKHASDEQQRTAGSRPAGQRSSGGAD
jgi:hypothetical protein